VLSQINRVHILIHCFHIHFNIIHSHLDLLYILFVLHVPPVSGPSEARNMKQNSRHSTTIIGDCNPTDIRRNIKPCSPVEVTQRLGRAIAQAVSLWLPTREDPIRARVWSRGICGGQSGAGAGFSPSTSVSPVNLQSTNFSTITIIYHLGLVQ
jgi:hypothetical protein